MKVAREQIANNENSSFRLLLTPMLNDLYYWHFHPECEIVYVEAAEGTRHIGDHISLYKDKDLVLIGPNIPHLNFDYGVTTACEQVILQFREDLLGAEMISMPEFQGIGELLQQARQGIAFHGATRDAAAELLKQMPAMSGFDQMLQLLRVFRVLSVSNEYTLLGAAPIVHAREEKEMSRLQRVYKFLDEHYALRINIGEVAALVHLSVPAFCRFFKKQTGITFTEFVNQFRISQSRKLLLQQRTVTEACYASGFDNLSYYTRTFRKVTGEAPSQFRKKFSAA